MAFIANTEILAGLSNTGGTLVPGVFFYNSSLYLFEGRTNTVKKWNNTSSTWEATTEFTSHNAAIGTWPTPAYFYMGTDLCVIYNSDNTWKAFIWNGSQWISNTALKTGITNTAWGRSTIFFINSDMYLIHGNSNGEIKGYKWNGTQWDSDSGIVSGLPADIGDYSSPSAFYSNSELCIIIGVTSGYYGYKWNGSQWVSNSALISGLTSYSSYQRPCVFDLNSTTYLISGNSSGDFKAFEKTADPQPPKLSSIDLVPIDVDYANLTVTLSAPLTANETLKAWNGTLAEHMTNNDYLVTLVKIDDLTYRVQVPKQEITPYFIKVQQLEYSNSIQILSKNGDYTVLPIPPIVKININNASNYRIFPSPNRQCFNHGLIHYNGAIFGSGRNGPTFGEIDIFKIVAADYSSYIQKTTYVNKNASTGRLAGFDQIIQIGGFLWVSSATYLIRINPVDLDYMVFNGLPSTMRSEPMCSDGNYIYYSAGLSCYKLDVNLLLGSFASYGYTGDAAVAIPSNLIVGSCAIVQLHPSYGCYVHAAAVDSHFLYLSVTTCDGPASGYDSALDISYCHLQKVRKTDMVIVGDVVTPRSTDDMAQNGEYLFLGPEMQSDSDESYPFGTWEFYAVNKQTLEIKYLKRLHHDHISQPLYHGSFGVFIIGDKVAVINYPYKQLFILNLSNIESWGDRCPFAYATEAVYEFQLNGVDFVQTFNEFVIDNNLIVHMNTWQADTMVFKYPLSAITTAIKTPMVITTLISSSSNNATVGGFIGDEGLSAITNVGFRYGTSPESLSINVDVSPDTYDFQTVLSSLTPGIYYIQAWGTNTEGTFYGNTVIFSTFNAVTLAHDNASAVLQWLDAHRGHSIRCVQDAPGVADLTTGTATDQDGNQYNTIVINEKRWFVENLRTTTYRNGEPIPNITDPTNWASAIDGAMSSYANNNLIAECVSVTTTTTTAPVTTTTTTSA